MLRAYVGRTTDLRKEIVLRILQRLAARFGRVEQLASTDEAFVDFASRVERLLCQEITASGRDVGHADRVQPVPYVVIFSGDHTDKEVAAPAATASPFPKGKPGPNRVEEHRRFARHAQKVFGDDLSTLPPKLFLDFAKALDADPEIILPPSYDSFAAYLTPRVSEGTDRKRAMLARTTREQAFRTLIKNRLKSLRAAELEALMRPQVMPKTRS
jgi:hypothetical protein